MKNSRTIRVSPLLVEALEKMRDKDKKLTGIPISQLAISEKAGKILLKYPEFIRRKKVKSIFDDDWGFFKI